MMGDEKPTYEELEARLAEAEKMLKAIRNEKIDALIGNEGVYLLRLKETEKALQESEQRLRIAKEAAELGIHDYDVASGIIKADERIRELWGLEPQSPFNYDTFILGLHPDDREPTQQKVDRALNQNGNGKYYAEYRVRALNDGTERWVAATGQVIFEAGKAVQLIGTVQEITERKQAEEALRETNQELNEYAYALTHNLKAPLRAINNYVNFLYEDLSETLEGEPKTYLERLKDAIILSNKQFEDLESLYKVKNHAENFEPFEMSELIDEIQSIFKNSSDRKLIVAKDWPVFRGERFLIRQILIELIKNGFKFNRADIRCVEVGWQTAEENGIELFVRDNGIGIEAKYQPQIFNIFRRLHTEREYQGTGIGLAIVKRANQKIGGRLRLESQVGRGSTFYVRLQESIAANRFNGNRD